MRRSTLNIIILSSIAVLVFANAAEGYWIWTPETKKFINPKYAVKDTPKEQFDWAMSFYNARDFQKAATEFEKLAKQYEFSEYASKAQYYVGLCYENMQKYYIAYENYQKTIDNFPHISNTDEILAREYDIGNIYLNKPSPKVLKTDIMAPLDRAVDIFKKVVENAPYGKFAEDAQFKLGEALKKGERYEEAVQAFHKVAEDYPNSKLVTQAMFEEADCAYKSSLRPAYDAASTDSAIKTFEKFVDKNKNAGLTKEADMTMKRLKDNVAEKSFRTAEFYESQGKKDAAIIYYQDVIDTCPESSFVDRARLKIEALKTVENKKASAPLDFFKKKPKAVKQEVQKAREAPKKKPWSPLSFSSKKPEAKKKAEATTQQAPPKKPWNPLSFLSKKTDNKEKAATIAKEPAKKKEWKPLNFSPKKEEVAKTPAVPTVETPAVATPVVEVKKKPWNLFGFGVKQEWKPLNFGTNDKPMGSKETQEVLNSGKN